MKATQLNRTNNGETRTVTNLLLMKVEDAAGSSWLRIKHFGLLALLACLFSSIVPARKVNLVPVAEGWSKNSVNTVVFRRNSLVTHKDVQYMAFYDQEQYVVLAKRKLNSGKWTIQRTQYKGNAADAHTAISLMTDGDGFRHISWGHHNNPLHYAKSIRPGALALGEKMPMTGIKEENVTYPEFYRLPNGNLLFFYRDGSSGNGNVVINEYDIATREWTQVQPNLIDGQGERNAYWQACVDAKGTIHISWVWRETYDVASNHDLCYARSKDGGKTWENARGEPYTLPIRAGNAAIAQHIPQNSALINQTSMTADSRGNPLIATYWREKGTDIPQYRLVYYQDNSWHNLTVSSRTIPFSLSGGGTKRIPIARPQVMVRESGGKKQVFVVFRGKERGNKVSVAVCDGFPEAEWEMVDLTRAGVGSWEPSYDTQLWQREGILHLFVQEVEQVDQEGLADHPPEMIYVLEWDPPE